MNAIFEINQTINEYVWGAPMLCFITGTGIYLTILLGFPQLRYFSMVWKEVSGKKNVRGSYKSHSSFAAMAKEISTTVGMGNVAGVATALHLGGPGALFWMLASAFFGMCTKFAEIILAVHFREKDENGNWRGGTMYVLEHGAKKKWLAVAFAVFAFLASFVIGPVVQANSMAEGMHLGFGIDPLYSGIALIIFTALVIPGGFTSIHAAASFLIPFISIVYIMASLIVLALHAAYIPVAIGQAVKYAFSDPMAIPGALAGWSVKMAITKGISRGLFSNEAGLGSAQKVHATANVDHPVRQGLYGIFEVFVDTMIICSMTALVILTTQSLTGEFGRELSGAQLTLFAFEAGLGSFGRYILAVGFPLFAYTTILGWYAYGRTAAVYLFGVEFKPVMKILWMLMILFGAAGADFFGAEPNAFLHSIWDLADTLNAFMAIPNLIGLLLLSGVIRRLVKDFDEKRKSGEIKI